MYSGWVGDQDPTFDGLQDALRNCFKSGKYNTSWIKTKKNTFKNYPHHLAWAKYVNFGSDIGGYRHGTRSRNVFIRWAQWGAFMPLMEVSITCHPFGCRYDAYILFLEWWKWTTHAMEV